MNTLISKINAKKQKSITHKVLKIVFSIYFLIAIIITAIHIVIEYKNAEKHLINRLNSLIDTFSPSLYQAFFFYNTDALHSVIYAFLKNPEVAGIQIYDTTDSRWGISAGVVLGGFNTPMFYDDFNLGKKELFDYKLIESPFIVKNKDNNNNEVVYATGVLYSSFKIAFSQIKITIYLILTNALIKTIALGYIFLITTRKYLTSIIEEFTSAVEKINLKNLKKINVAGKERYELSRLENSFNTMVQELQNAIDNKFLLENYLKDILDSMPSGLIGISKNGVIVHWNKHAETIFNSEAGTVVNKPYQEVLYFFSLYFDSIDISLKEQKKFLTDGIKYKKPGTNKSMVLSLLVYPLKISSLGVILQVNDITEQLEMQRMLLQNETFTAMGSLVSSLANEVNQPIARIARNAQILQRRTDIKLNKNIDVAQKHKLNIESLDLYFKEREVIKYIDEILEASINATKIIKNVLRLSYNNEKNIELVNINEVIQEAIAITMTNANIKKYILDNSVKFIILLQDNLPQIPIVFADLQQVIVRIVNYMIDNIIAHFDSKKQDGTVKIITKNDDQYASIILSDNGPGITAEEEKILFKFTPLKYEDLNVQGIASCKFIIEEKFKGKLRLQNMIGAGVSFTIDLPIYPDRINNPV